MAGPTTSPDTKTRVPRSESQRQAPLPIYTFPPAGSTPYPLSADIINSHPLFTNPPYEDQPFRPPDINYQNFAGLLGKKGLHQSPLRPSNQLVPEGHWTTPQEYFTERPTYEAEREASIKRYPCEKETGLVEEGKEGHEEEQSEVAATAEVYTPKSRRLRRIKKPKKLTSAMPSATATKRVKGKRIERPFIIGSEAWPLDETNTRKPDTDPSHTKGWLVYVKAPDGQPPITTWLKKVQFKIFHTYTNPTRMIEEPPFQVEETGWGGFHVEIKLFFIPEVGSRPQDRSHYLQLEPYGDEDQQAKQKEDKMVRAETLDWIEFNEPTEALFDVLTDETQFRARPKSRGKGKAPMKREEGEGSVELPETSTSSNPYSKELEESNVAIARRSMATLLSSSNVAMLRRAMAQIEEMNATEDKRLKALREEKAQLIGQARI